MSFGPLSPHARERLDELNRIIGGLNDTFALQLRPPDVTLSPRKYRERQRSDEEARIDDIYTRIRRLHFGRDDRLVECLGHFRRQGQNIIKAASRNSSNRVATTTRALLQECLLEILRNVNNLESKEWSKRVSDEIPDNSPKRARGQVSHSYEHHDAVDALPVRSSDSDSFLSNGTTAVSGSRSRGGAPPSCSQQRSFDRSFLTSRASFHSDVFSSKYTQDAPFGSQTTVDSGSQDMSKGYLEPDSTTGECFFRSYGSSQSRNNLQQTTVSLPRRPNETTEKIENPDNSQSKSFVLRQASSESAGGTLRHKLINIWPKLPLPGLTEAPLAVMWEVTRAALHCNVSLDHFDLLYEPNDRWHNQANLRDAISKHHLFHGKSLPQSSDSAAWQTAMGDFQTKVKTVTLSAELVYNQDEGGPLYSLRLNPLKLELGHRLERRFGADRFLEITVPSPSVSTEDRPSILKEGEGGLEKVVDWLTKSRHHFLGRCWKPFFVRHDNKGKGKKPAGAKKAPSAEKIYLFACDGHNFRKPITPDGIPPLEEALHSKSRTKLKLSGLLGWAVGIGNARNAEQPVTKLFSRLALSLSRTWPTAVLERNQIIVMDKDLGADGMVMNDGIGRISLSLAKKVAESLGLSDCPSCFQGRLGSAKGMWLIDVEGDRDPEGDWVEIYPSQTKWECDFEDPHHRTLEIRNWPKELKSASLNQQFIPVLEARSPQPDTMRQVISGHLERALLADLGEQEAAIKDVMSLRLWIHQSGPSNDRSLGGYAEFVAGLPDNNADKVAFLLDSGFSQTEQEYVKDLVWDMCKKKAETLKTKMNITIPCSAYIYMAADFSSTLEEGEVHLSFSTKFQAEGFSDTLLEDMDILVARAPAHLPSDIQKVKVVSRPELRKLKDVIIFSTKGSGPLADKLSGGDYDGDMAWVCWDQDIVKNFESVSVPDKTDLIERGYLRKMRTKFADILDNVESRSYYDDRSEHLEDACVEFIYQAFLFSLQPSFLGICTKYKEKYCYWEDSVQERGAIELSQLLGYLVDQSKQGIEFTRDDWLRFCTQNLGKQSTYLDMPAYANETETRPDPRRRIHILDYLRFCVAEKLIKDVLIKLGRSINAESVTADDDDLTKLHNLYARQASTSPACRRLLTELRDEIAALHKEWGVRLRIWNGDSVEAIYQKWLDIKPPEWLLASGEFQELLQDLHKDSAMSNWQLLKASTTFNRHHKHGQKFAWYMAGKQLAYIKAMEHRVPGETARVMVIPEMWGILRPDKKLIMSLTKQRETARDSESELALEEVFEFDDNGTVIDDA